jgi:hypothetical protein
MVTLSMRLNCGIQSQYRLKLPLWLLSESLYAQVIFKLKLVCNTYTSQGVEQAQSIVLSFRMQRPLAPLSGKRQVFELMHNLA